MAGVSLNLNHPGFQSVSDRQSLSLYTLPSDPFVDFNLTLRRDAPGPGEAPPGGMNKIVFMSNHVRISNFDIE